MSINWLVYLLQQRLPGAIEFFENGLGVCRPAVGFGIEIVMIEKAEDVDDQGPDAAKAARADDLGSNFAKEAFHQIEPEEEVGMKWMWKRG
jgi:hypothetical protein